MPRQKNDGRGRIGGRQRGTPNKATSTMRDWLFKLVVSNKSQIKRDLKSLEPRDRLAVLEKLMRYCIPALQAITAEVSAADAAEWQEFQAWKAQKAKFDGMTEEELIAESKRLDACIANL